MEFGQVWRSLVSLAAALMMMFIPMTKSATDTVQTVTVPFSSCCHSVIYLLKANLILMPPKYI